MRTLAFSQDAATRVRLQGLPDEIARFIQELQLKNTADWKLFVKQFRDHSDDEKLSWKGEYWGKLMRGGCITWQYTRDEGLYRVLTDTVLDLLEAQDGLGRICTYSVEKEFHGWDLWCRKYVLLGFLHYLEICQDEALKERVLSAAKAELDYLLRFIGPGKLDITQTSECWQGVNASSILEPVVRMYRLTGEERYLAFADYIVERGGAEKGNIFQLACEGKLYPHQYPVTKAYELMSCMEGLLEYYLARGGEHWKAAVCDFAHKISQEELSVIGCAGCMHEFFDNGAVTQTNFFYNGVLQETCVAVTWMKFCARLLLLTGDPFYADQIETCTYNAIYGSVNLNKCSQNGGLPFDSYSPLTAATRARGIGGYQLMENGTFFYGCCAAIGAAGTGLFPNLHLLKTESGAVLSFYTAGTYRFTTPQGQEAVLTVKTEYPYEGTVALTLQVPNPEVFDLQLRIPAFCRWAKCTVNGEKPVLCDSGYFRLHRCWGPETAFALKLDMHPRSLGEPYLLNVMHRTPHFAVLYGPLVLARDARLSPDVGIPAPFDPEFFQVERTQNFGIGSAASFLVRTAENTVLKMVDYASAGTTWDENSRMECWLLQEL